MEPQIRWRVYYDDDGRTWRTDPIDNEASARTARERLKSHPDCQNVRLMKETTTYEEVA
jgi:hypothetical protein